jgi:hypothetical protein
MQVYVGEYREFGRVSLTLTYLTDRKPFFDWTMEIEGYWHKGTVPIWAMIIPSNYGRWWKKSFKAAREYGWDWYRLWNEYNDLITGEDRGIIMAHFDDTIKDKYEKVTKRFSDDLKINYIVVFDKLKEGWDEGPYHNLERTALLTDIKY